MERFFNEGSCLSPVSPVHNTSGILIVQSHCISYVCMWFHIVSLIPSFSTSCKFQENFLSNGLKSLTGFSRIPNPLLMSFNAIFKYFILVIFKQKQNSNPPCAYHPAQQFCRLLANLVSSSLLKFPSPIVFDQIPNILDL